MRHCSIERLVVLGLLLFGTGCGEEIHGDVELASEELFPPRYLERVGNIAVGFPTYGIRGIGFDGPFIPVPPDPYPAEMNAVVAERLSRLPGGASAAAVFASPSCLPEVLGLGTDSDADGIPDDATVTYSVANCTVYDSATGDIYLGRGSYRVRDTNNSLYGFRVDIVDLSVRDYDGARGITNDAVYNITETSTTSATGGTYHLVLDGWSSSLGSGFNTAQRFRWDLTQSFDPVGSIPAGGPLPDGILTVSGTADLTISEDDAPARMSMTIVGQTSLVYDDGCESFTSGSYQLRLQGTTTEGVQVVYAGCTGYFEPIGAGVL
jgi:hypothetical protein